MAGFLEGVKSIFGGQGALATPGTNPVPTSPVDAIDQKLKDTALKKGMLMGALGMLANSSMDRGTIPTLAMGALSGIQGYEQSLNKQRTNVALSSAASDPYFKGNMGAQMLLKAGKVGDAVKLAKVDDTTRSQRIMKLADRMSRGAATKQEKMEYWLLVQANPINQLTGQLLGGGMGGGGDPLGMFGGGGEPKPKPKPKPKSKPPAGGFSDSVLDDDF